MKVAIISDIHGNLDAFRQVLNDIDASALMPWTCDILDFCNVRVSILRFNSKKGWINIFGNRSRFRCSGYRVFES